MIKHVLFKAEQVEGYKNFYSLYSGEWQRVQQATNTCRQNKVLNILIFVVPLVEVIANKILLKFFRVDDSWKWVGV